MLILTLAAKLTLSRLNEQPAERKAREQKLAAAVRVILEGIGEDPAREGLLKTPERFAQALLWMTKGYEERLPGACLHSHLDLPPQQILTWTCLSELSLVPPISFSLFTLPRTGNSRPSLEMDPR